MGVVHHDQGLVPVSQVADAGEIGDDPVHGKDAVSGNDLEPAALGRLELGFQVRHVIVVVPEATGFAEPDPVDDAGMVEGVADDRILGAEQGFEEAAVGIEAGGVENGVLGSEEVADPGLEGLVDLVGAADEADRRHAEAVMRGAVLGGLDDRRVIGQAQVVVGAEIDHPKVF